MSGTEKIKKTQILCHWINSICVYQTQILYQRKNNICVYIKHRLLIKSLKNNMCTSNTYVYKHTNICYWKITYTYKMTYVLEQKLKVCVTERIYNYVYIKAACNRQ